VFQEKHETCVGLDGKKVPTMQMGQRNCVKCRKTVADLPEIFGDEAVVSPSSEYDINKKNLDDFKIDHYSPCFLLEQDSGVFRSVSILHQKCVPSKVFRGRIKGK
jgi:hypothetical protein